MTARLVSGAQGVREAARVLAGGGVVAMPTETVYGLAADAGDSRAVARVFAVKDRPRFNPLIHHVTGLAMARAHVRLPPAAEALAERFWPGPLTLVSDAVEEAGLSPLARAGLPTVAVRAPDHPLALALIDAVGRPLAAPSANPSGRLSPVCAEDVREALGERIEIILDGGRCRAGLESTIVGFIRARIILLRPGALAREEIERALGAPLEEPSPRRAGEGPTAPGALTRHYAPDAALRLDALDVRPGEAYLGFGPPPSGVSAALNLSVDGDLHEAAANLFFHLRTLARRVRHIAVAPIPSHGLGEAIRDRLSRAAAAADGDDGGGAA